MEVNIKQAIKALFNKPSFDMVFEEAVANSLDAGALNISISIILESRENLQNLEVQIKDDGCGFDDQHFTKFNRLFQVEEDSHKGLGRLSYLCYFDKVSIDSVFNHNKERKFIFNEEFKGKFELLDVADLQNGTIITMTGFTNQRLHRNDSINASYIRDQIEKEFYLRLYKYKEQSKRIVIKIRSLIGEKEENQIIDNSLMPCFSIKKLEDKSEVFDSIELLYHIDRIEKGQRPKVLTAYAIDERCYTVDIIAKENFPKIYNLTFFLVSSSLNGRVDASRQNIDIPDNQNKKLLFIFRKGIADVVKEQLPDISKRNERIVRNLDKTYPHLEGYFKNDDIGFSSREDILKDAQNKFFNDQREVLEKKDLSNEEYNKYLDVSSRTLAEYILFRQKVIDKLKNLTPENKECDLHNALVPKRSIFEEGKFIDSIYQNNVWVVDDKFMTYNKILSEREMSDVIEAITDGKVKDSDNDRPDITILLNADPTKSRDKLDVVIIELKRLGITAEQNSIAEFQLDTRTQKLAQYYENRIQRVWYYGIVSFDGRYIMHLINNQFYPLYSKSNVYFRSKEIYSDSSLTNKVIQNAYIMDFKALVEDADARNSTFLKLLKDGFKLGKTLNF